MAETIPTAPEGTREAGRRLWRSVVDEYDLETHELVLLQEAARTVDVLDELDAAVRRDGAGDCDRGRAPAGAPGAPGSRRGKTAENRISESAGRITDAIRR